MSGTNTMPVIPVVSVVTGGNVSTVLSGLVTVTVIPVHPTRGHAVALGSPVRINVSCPTPTGLGKAPIMGKVIIVAALAVGTARRATAIVSIRNKAIATNF